MLHQNSKMLCWIQRWAIRVSLPLCMFCMCVCLCFQTVGVCTRTKGERVRLLLKPCIIPAITSVSSDHRIGGQPSASRQLSNGTHQCLIWHHIPMFSALSQRRGTKKSGLKRGGGGRDEGYNRLSPDFLFFFLKRKRKTTDAKSEFKLWFFLASL